MTQRHGGASSAEAAQQRRLILPDFDGRIWVDASSALHVALAANSGQSSGQVQTEIPF